MRKTTALSLVVPLIAACGGPDSAMESAPGPEAFAPLDPVAEQTCVRPPRAAPITSDAPHRNWEVVPAGRTPVAEFTIDLNGDGIDDRVLLDGPGERVELTLTAADGTESGPMIYEPRGEPIAVRVADLDGAGDGDIVFLLADDDRLRVLSPGPFGLEQGELQMPLPARAIMFADLDNEGGDDLVGVSDDGLFVMHSRDDADHATSHFIQLDERPMALDSADVDGDGRADITVTFVPMCKNRIPTELFFLARDGHRVPSDPDAPAS